MKRTQGFTIIELMISTVVFSLVLLLVITGMVQISRAYYKGVSQTRVQEAARQTMEEVTAAIQLGGTEILVLNPTAGPNVAVGNRSSGVGAVCTGNVLYAYVLDRQVDTANNEDEKKIKNALLSREVTTCAPGVLDVGAIEMELENDPDANERSLLTQDMRLTAFSVNALPGDGDLWEIDMALAFGDTDLLRYTDDQDADRVVCQSGTGSEFCSIVELSTIIQRRIQ